MGHGVLLKSMSRIITVEVLYADIYHCHREIHFISRFDTTTNCWQTDGQTNERKDKNLNSKNSLYYYQLLKNNFFPISSTRTKCQTLSYTNEVLLNF